MAWKQLRQLALDADTSTQALDEEAVNLLFAKHGINRSARPLRRSQQDTLLETMEDFVAKHQVAGAFR